jgi:hypothetical protein
VTNPIFHKS